MNNEPALELRTGTLRFSWHARERMAELRISRDEVRRTTTNYQISRPGRNGCTELVGAAILVTLNWDLGVIVTVKLRTGTPYVHGIHHLHNLPTGEAVQGVRAA